MKHFYYFSVVAISASLLVSCSEDILLIESIEPLGDVNSVTATISDFNEAGGTRTVLDGDETLSLVWAENDTIGIFPNEGFQVAFPMAEGAGGKRAVFTGGGWGLKTSSTYSAYSPMIGQFYLNKTAIPLTMLGQTQNGNGNREHISAYDYLVAANAAVVDGKVNFDFRHLVTIVRLKLTMPKAGTYTSIVLKTNGEFVTEGTFSLTDGLLTSTKVSGQQVLQLKNVTLADDDLTLDAYMAIVPAELEGKTLRAEVNDSEGNCYTVDLVGLDFIAGDFYKFTRNEMAETLPMVTICTPEGQAVTSKEVYIANSLISVAEIEEATFNIKGRGNSTWSAPKKPYAIKFDKKTSLLSLPEDKSWVLLANYYDASLLRNDLAFYMGNEMSLLDYTPHFHSVELTMNGEYKGVYQLGEKLKIGKKRVNVGDDGFLLEIDAKAGADEITFKTSHLGQPVNIKDPDVAVDDENYNYVKNYVATAEAALYADNFTDPDEGWQKYMDLDSFVEWYLINEIAKNNDAIFYTSCYMNLKRDGKLKMGPLWDFDLAFGGYWNNERGQTIANVPENFYIKDATWYARLFQDPAFVSRVKERFNYYYDNRQLIYDHIDEMAVLMKEKAVEDNKLWGTICDKSASAEDVKTAYQENIVYLKNWIATRLEWLKTNIDALKDQ